MTINKYAAALLSIAIAILTAFVAIPEDGRTPETMWQVALLGVGAIVTYLVPIVQGRWAGVLKTGAAIAAAAIGALIPLLNAGMLSSTQIIVLVLAGLNALAVEVGVGMRKSDMRLAA